MATTETKIPVNPSPEQIASMQAGDSFEAEICGSRMIVTIQGSGATFSMNFLPKNGLVAMGKAMRCEAFAQRHNARFGRLENTATEGHA